MPMVQKRVKCYSKTNKPWVTPAIRKSIHRKNSLYKRYLKTKFLVIKEKYKKYKKQAYRNHSFCRKITITTHLT